MRPSSMFGLLAMSSALLPAQKMPLPEGDRVVQVLDVGDLLSGGSGSDSGATESPIARLAAFVRAFAGPRFGGEADLQALGERRLVTLGSPVQLAAVEQLLARLRKEAGLQFQIDVRIHRASDAAFDRVLAPRLPAVDGQPNATRVVVVDAKSAAALRREVAGTDIEIVQVPQVAAETLHHVRLEVGSEHAYVRDFELEVQDGVLRDGKIEGGAVIANPIVDKVWDGLRIEATMAKVTDGGIGIQLEMLEQQVERPINTVTTSLPGAPKTAVPLVIQVPVIRGCRGSQVAVVPTGGAAIMAARRNGGGWLVVISTVHEVTFEKPR